jgi:glycosyltransferase involved in cell wall biosynthesis
MADRDMSAESQSLPVFSVVTCCFNQGQFLKENIESVLAQDYPRFEHIVVDDGSTDNTRAVCAAYPHVRYIHQANAGQSAALNRGFQEAKGDIIAWVNSDDFYEPHAFKTVARELRPDLSRLIVAGAAKVVNAQGHYQWMLRNGNVSFFRLLFHHRLYPFNGWTVMPCQPSVFFHRAVLEKLGLLDTKLRLAMDYEYWLRALRAGFSFHYVPQFFSLYRYHATSNSNQGFDTFAGEWKQVSDRYYRQLSAGEQTRAELWWKLARVECFFVQRDKAAYGYCLQRFGPDPSTHPLAPRILVTLRAMLIAPWVPLTLFFRRRAELRLFDREKRLAGAAL